MARPIPAPVTPKPYVRPMAGWWRRHGFYGGYMLREASSVFVTAYAVVLLWGLVRLSQGRAAFDAWRESLASPLAIVFHLIALALVIYHAWTWFQLMPKTMPFIRFGGKRISDRLIVRSGQAALIAVTIIVWLAVWGTKP
ncbi:MAG TPA: fumarate reductase subunit C [Burkholderiaceae bacterium]|nr:fumarate reductase subunit C [Burkholderiaceae bacterium]